MRSILFVVGLGISLSACGSKSDPGPSCEAVVDHMLDITKQQLVGHDNVVFASQKKAMVAQCKTRNMPAETRKCLIGAETISDIAKCRGGKTDVIERPRRPSIRPVRPPGANGSNSVPRVVPPSAGSGSAAGSDGKPCPIARRLPGGGCAPE